MIVGISVESVVMSLYHFFIASVWFFYFFCCINVASGLFFWSFHQTSSRIYSFFEGFFCISISFSSALILIISYLLIAFDISFDLAPLALSIWWSGVNFRSFLLLIWAFIAIKFPIDTALYVSQRFCYVCVFVLIGFKEHLYFCLYFIVYPVNIQKPVVQPVSMKLCGSGSVSEFWVLTWLHYGLRGCLLWFQLFCICWAVLYFQLCGQF